MTGVNADNVQKLLGVPDCPDGCGASEFRIVRDLLIDWKIWEEVCGMVFDTTNSNSGAEAGACRFLEIWCGFCGLHADTTSQNSTSAMP